MVFLWFMWFLAVKHYTPSLETASYRLVKLASHAIPTSLSSLVMDVATHSAFSLHWVDFHVPVTMSYISSYFSIVQVFLLICLIYGVLPRYSELNGVSLLKRRGPEHHVRSEGGGGNLWRLHQTSCLPISTRIFQSRAKHG